MLLITRKAAKVLFLVRYTITQTSAKQRSGRKKMKLEKKKRDIVNRKHHLLIFGYFYRFICLFWVFFFLTKKQISILKTRKFKVGRK